MLITNEILRKKNITKTAIIVHLCVSEFVDSTNAPQFCLNLLLFILFLLTHNHMIKKSKITPLIDTIMTERILEK